VIAALSDLKEQIQARDLVRFLVGRCSVKKIEEIGQENAELSRIFTKLRSLPEPDRQIPFTRDQVKLEIADLKSLEDNGAIVREGEDYYMPEIFRVGLGFRLPRGARPRVMTLARGTKR
jgi:hypothetical protein